MALKHAEPLEVIDLAPDHDLSGATVSHSLIRTGHLQLMKLVLAAGHQVPTHQVVGEITIQCLAGAVTVEVAGREIAVAAGSLTVVPAGESHAVRADVDSALLVTILLRSA